MPELGGFHGEFEALFNFSLTGKILKNTRTKRDIQRPVVDGLSDEPVRHGTMLRRARRTKSTESAGAFPALRTVPRNGADFFFAGRSTSATSTKTGHHGECQQQQPAFHKIDLVNNNVADAWLGKLETRQDFGDAGVFANGLRLNFRNHFVGAIDDEFGFGLDVLITTEVENNEIPVVLHDCYATT